MAVVGWSYSECMIWNYLPNCGWICLLWMNFLTFSFGKQFWNLEFYVCCDSEIDENNVHPNQRWSRGHKPQDQGQKNPRPRTALSRPDPLDAKDRNARGQEPRIQAQVSSKKKLLKFFFRRSPKRKVLKKFCQAICKILTIQEIVLSSSRGQSNFLGLEASRPRTWPLRPRPRTSKCVLEDVLEAKEVFEDFTSDPNHPPCNYSSMILKNICKNWRRNILPISTLYFDLIVAKRRLTKKAVTMTIKAIILFINLRHRLRQPVAMYKMEK